MQAKIGDMPTVLNQTINCYLKDVQIYHLHWT